MRRAARMRPDGIMSLTEEIKQVYPRHVSQPSVEASNAEWWENEFYDYIQNGGTLNFNDFKDLMLREGDIGDLGAGIITPVRYTKVEKPPLYDSNKPVTLQDYLDWGMTLGNLDEQSLESLKFMFDKLQEPKK